ncbi:peptide ABC transporter [Bacillus sp. SA1-12]|uniref:cyclic peptide export ABC transporter n=1 Tax=Bacillus sp. SA1-12 TaxID=1455638 RepID=UPI000627196C|nr:cyclic peptide export ABC transporter [Bacillus sp. SA1-12]KKI89727.1 peptide ABC transporter [Bacillus sp. SA1-12]
MVNVKIILLVIGVLLSLPLMASTQIVNAENNRVPLSNDDQERLDEFIEHQMDEGKIPGMSLVVVKGDQTVYKKGFGYSDLKEKKLVTDQTLFEIASNTKAFTALAIQQLAEKGQLSLNDSVSKYLPWFQMKYEGEYQGLRVNENVDITIKQLLHHTSGIPFNTIGRIPIASDDKALENTVRGLVNQSVDTYPGEQFVYSSINYDILGLIIQEVTSQSYESYVQTMILDPLKMEHTHLFRDEANRFDLAKGYKIGFLKPNEYDAPIYRGNTPAGYIISNANDMERWLRAQVGTLEDIDRQDKVIQQAIEQTHLPNRSVPPSADGSSYAGGWEVYQTDSGEISHTGSNPTYSSFVVFRPEEKLGVAILANMNSDYTQSIGQGVINLLLKKEMPAETKDMYQSIDSFSFTVLLFMVPFSCLTIYFMVRVIMQVIQKKRSLEANKMKRLGVPMISMIFVLAAGYSLYKIPALFFSGLSWDFVYVWAPISMVVAAWASMAGIFLFCSYLSLISIYPNTVNKTRNLFPLFVLSAASGFGNAFIIFIINAALNRPDLEANNQLFLYFAMGMIVYVLAQKLVRTQLINLTNNLIYEQRLKLLNKILENPYEKIERSESEKIQTVLNNDTEAISNYAPSIITGLTDSITLLCCLVYLGVINIYGLFISIGVILAAAGFYYAAGRSANKLWEQTRNIQNIFFRYINDLIGGYKELSLAKSKREEFKDDMKESISEYKEKRIQGGLKFANVFIIGELLFVLVIGAVTFLFPLLFKDVQSEFLRSYVFVFLYMTGPIHSILNAIPNAIQMRISWRRINEFSNYLEIAGAGQKEAAGLAEPAESVTAAYKGIGYQYENEHGESFEVGPIDVQFKSGEIVFITGGNGSGKSTLAKLLTGLYPSKSGEIMINHQQVNQEEITELFSVIFSDYYLFNKVYGIDCSTREDEIKHYLHTLRIDDKIQIQNGKFSTTKLSTGQRKRLALLISYLEDKPIHLFDEWAADQDPEFRSFFYMELLPDLKEKGKCVIAITHDDRYFHLADKVIKMERGKIVEEVHPNEEIKSFI